MKKITILRICDWSLPAVMVLMLVSSVQLEGWWLGMGFVLAHIFIGIAFILLIGWHLKLHFQWNNRYLRLKRQKSHVTKWLAVFGALTLLTAVIATIRVLITCQHSSIGGWHGKIGFVFIAIAIGHTVKRARFYKR